MRNDYGNALRAFHSIARHGSFTRAALELEVSASALSQAISQLERRVGVRLLQRTTRNVGLTEAGKEFLARVSPALDEIDDAVENLRQHGERPGGTLRLTVPQSILPSLIEPMLADFLREYPQIRLDLRVDSGLNDLISDGLDAGIRLGEKVQRDMVAIPLGGPARSIVVGAPAYFAAHGRPKHPRDLQAHRCVRFRFSLNTSIYRWEFAERGRWFQLDVEGPLVTNDHSIALRAVLDGVGLWHVLERYVREHVAAGRLETVLDAWLPPYDGFYLYYPSRRQVPPKLRVFIDFLRARLRKDVASAGKPTKAARR
jgi:DNA-binding transcriptional LysR family regulator